MNAAIHKREHILREGSRIMHQKGYNATGVKEIVDAAGIPKGSFYNYFESKEHFAVEALRFMAGEEFARGRALLSDASRPPLARIEVFFAEYLKHVKTAGEYCTGCFIGNLCQEVADHNEAICKEVERQLGIYEAHIGDCLEEAQRRGDLGSRHDPKTLAAFIFGSWQGAVLRMKACKSAVPLEGFQEVLIQDLLRR